MRSLIAFEDCRCDVVNATRRAEQVVKFLAAELVREIKGEHLLAPLPPDMRDDTAFMDRLHAYAPGWEFPKLDPRRPIFYRSASRV